MAFGQVPENPELARPVCQRQTSLQRPDLLRHGVPESQRLGGTAGNECGRLDRPSSPQELNTGSHWNLIKCVIALHSKITQITTLHNIWKPGRKNKLISITPIKTCVIFLGLPVFQTKVICMHFS